MELEQIKNRITALETKVSSKQTDIQNLLEDIQRLEQDNANKREEIKKYKTVVEVMEL